MPTGLASYLPDEPTTLHEAKVSPEWPQWCGALKREMDGQIARGVWKVVDRPKGKTVLGTKTVFKRKVGQDGRVEKYKCRFVAKGFRQIKGIHYQESLSPTPTQSSIRMALAVMALLDWEGRQLDVEMAFLEADVTEELYVELPDGYRDSPNQVGRLQKAMYGLMHAGLLWSKKFGGELISKGFERSQADPCVFRRKHLGKVVVIIVVYVDDLLLSAWVDADHASCPDTRRSVSGGAVMLGGGAVSWFSRAQRITATATSSEYVALAEVVNELRFLRQVKAFMVPPIDYNIRVHEDNEGAIKMAENRFSSRRTRHIDVKHHMVRDAVDGGIIRVEYVKSREQHADVLTKAIDAKSFERHARFLLNVR
ncbi:unnamed protein product [Ascophyllum nodosum]